MSEIIGAILFNEVFQMEKNAMDFFCMIGMIEILDSGSFKSLYLIGHSMGGLVSFNMAIRNLLNKPVDRIVCISSPLWGSWLLTQVRQYFGCKSNNWHVNFKLMHYMQFNFERIYVSMQKWLKALLFWQVWILHQKIWIAPFDY